jgi:hypothetical protein
VQLPFPDHQVQCRHPSMQFRCQLAVVLINHMRGGCPRSSCASLSAARRLSPCCHPFPHIGPLDSRQLFPSHLSRITKCCHSSPCVDHCTVQVDVHDHDAQDRSCIIQGTLTSRMWRVLACYLSSVCPQPALDAYRRISTLRRDSSSFVLCARFFRFLVELLWSSVVP